MKNQKPLKSLAHLVNFEIKKQVKIDPEFEKAMIAYQQNNKIGSNLGD